MSTQNKRRVLLVRKKAETEEIAIQTQEIPLCYTNSPKSLTFYDASHKRIDPFEPKFEQTFSNFSQLFNINSTPILPAARSISVTNHLRSRVYNRSRNDLSLDVNLCVPAKCEICKHLPCLCKKWKKIEDSFNLKITQNHFLTDIIKKKKEARPVSALIQYAGYINQGKKSLPAKGCKRSRSKISKYKPDLNDSINIRTLSQPPKQTQNSKHNIETVIIPQAQTESKTYERIRILLENYLKSTKNLEAMKEKLCKFYLYIKKYSAKKRNPCFSKKIDNIAKFIARHHEKLRLNPALIPLMNIELVTSRQLLMFDRFLCSLFRLVS